MREMTLKDWCVWIAYVVMLAVTVPFHEPWADEAQAWLLARDSTLAHLLMQGLRHEGHPALWYLILFVPTHLHCSYLIFGWISATIAAAGIYVLLRLSPFPFYLRAILPFTFFLAYQYAIVNRSYVVFPLLGFLIAHTYRLEPARLLRMALLLGLMANLCIHGTLVACVFGAFYFWEAFRDGGGRGIARWEVVFASVLFVASLGVVVFTHLPPPDLPETLRPAVTRMLHLPQAVPASSRGQAPLNPPAGPRRPPVGEVHPASLPPIVPVAQQPGGLLYRLADLPRILSFSISNSNLLAAALYLLLVIFLGYSRKLRLVLPLIVLGLFLDFIYAREWHLGMVWITLLMIVWTSWSSVADKRRSNLQSALSILLFLISLLQIPWTWQAFRYDIHSPYSGGKAAAAYLGTLPQETRIAGFEGLDTAIQPYFPKNIFFNQAAYAYGNLSSRDTVAANIPQTIASRPDVIVVHQDFRSDGSQFLENPIFTLAQTSGYRETHRFCGHSFRLRGQQFDQGCYLLLQLVANPAANWVR